MNEIEQKTENLHLHETMTDYVSRDASSSQPSSSQTNSPQFVMLYTREGALKTYSSVLDKAPKMKNTFINYSSDVVNKILDFLSNGKIGNVEDIRDIAREFDVPLPKNKLSEPIDIDKIINYDGILTVNQGKCVNFKAEAEYKIGKYFFKVLVEIRPKTFSKYHMSTVTEIPIENEFIYYHHLMIWNSNGWCNFHNPYDQNTFNKTELTSTYSEILGDLQKHPNRKFAEISPPVDEEEKIGHFGFIKKSKKTKEVLDVVVNITNENFYENLFRTIYKLYSHRLTNLYAH